MTLFLNLVFLVLGLAFLIKGADIFVDGASSVAKKLKIPSLIIGLTIVALGTSLPELAVSVVAAINNNLHPGNGFVDMSVGNVVGSNIFNTLIVLGVTALVTPIAIEKKVLKFEMPYLLGISIFLLLIAIIEPHTISWIFGLIFLILLTFYIVFLIKRTKKEKVTDEEFVSSSSTLKDVLMIVIGAASIGFGGECVNSTATVIASLAGMDKKLIALTIVALGTSLPELVTSVVAAKKGENDIALGNVIGSNTLNILFILGFAALITPLPISSEMIVDLSFLAIITIIVVVLSIISLKRKGLYRISGLIMITLYVLYLAYIISRNYGFLPNWMI